MLFGDNSGSPAGQTIDDAEDSRYVHVGSNAVEPEELLTEEPEELLTEEPEEGETDLPSDENVDEDTAIGYGNEHSSNENEGIDAGEKGDRETEMNTEEPETLNADN